ncbi:MAG: caspase family protein [Hyphomicrobiales bacterium]|nr:caspase family protein [Hyphomicrobiales bacterium]
MDGEGENSSFITELLEHMETPDLEIELMLKRAKSDVFEKTDGNRCPWNNSALRKEFYFVK